MTADEREPTAEQPERRSPVLPRIINNFVHDMSTGVWAASVLVISVVSSRSEGTPPQAAVVLLEANRLVFGLLAVSLGGLAVTGGIRLLYWRSDTPVAHLKEEGALAVNHAAFAVVYGFGTLWAASRVFT